MSSHFAVKRYALAAIAFCSAPAAAAESDTQFWVQLGTVGELGGGWTGSAIVEQRRQEGANVNIAGVGADLAVSDGLAVGGGVQVFDEGGFTELRTYQQARFTTGPLVLQTRLEERFFDDADQMGLRLRQLALFSQPLGSRTSASVSAEWFYQLRDRVEAGPRRTDQWRFIAAVRHRVAERVDLTGGYLFLIRPRPDGATTHSHIPQLTATYRF